MAWCRVWRGITSTALAVTMGRTTMPYQGYKTNREITPTYSDYLLAKQRGRQIENVAAVDAYNSFLLGTTVTANGRAYAGDGAGLHLYYHYTTKQDHIWA